MPFVDSMVVNMRLAIIALPRELRCSPSFEKLIAFWLIAESMSTMKACVLSAGSVELPLWLDVAVPARIAESLVLRADAFVLVVAPWG